MAIIIDGNSSPSGGGSTTPIQLLSGPSSVSASIPQVYRLVGVGFLQGGASASIVLGSGTSALTISANAPGTPGNLLQIALVDSASPGVTVSPVPVPGQQAVSTLVVVSFRGPSHGNADTANAVALLINRDLVAGLLMQAIGGGTGIVAPVTATSLAGGIGSGLRVLAEGLAQDLFFKATDSRLDILMSNLPAPGASTMSLTVESNGFVSNALSISLM